MTEQGAGAVLVGRPHWSRRVSAATAGPVALAVGALGVSEGRWLLGPPLVLIGLLLISELWRKVTVSGDRLVAQGRWRRRTVALDRLRQVTLSPMAYPWVQTHDDEVFYLGMVSREMQLTGGAARNPGVWVFTDLLRTRAEAAGARLEPRPLELVAPPPGGERLFGL